MSDGIVQTFLDILDIRTSVDHGYSSNLFPLPPNTDCLYHS